MLLPLTAAVILQRGSRKNVPFDKCPVVSRILAVTNFRDGFLPAGDTSVKYVTKRDSPDAKGIV